MIIAAIATLSVLVVIAIWIVAMYNHLNGLVRRVDQSWSNLDVALQNRWETIPPLVATVKAAAAFQGDTLTKVIEARAAAMGATTLEGKAEAENALQGALGKLFALAESYPSLTAVDSYRDLQAQILKLQDTIVGARRIYNSNVTEFNITRSNFPNVILFKRFAQFSARDLFEIENEDMRTMPSVNIQDGA